MNTPINTISPSEATQRIIAILQQAYFRRSRQLPANIADIATTLKGDLLKAFPDVPIETVDDAIITSTLHDTDTQLSPAFFFNAVKKVWFTPKTNRHAWDEEEYRRPDTEQDTISLLDTCAEILKKQDEATVTADPKKPLKHVVELPAFNARREYAYLTMRRQLNDDSLDHFFDQALTDVNTERMATRHHRLDRDEARDDPHVVARQKRLAVLSWLRACNIQGRKPSDILTPLIDELTYSILRKSV